MSPAPPSPVTKAAHSHRTSSQDSSADGIRKRVCKACDRCRLKKSKCDGSNPCSRCKADNAICVFGERKKSHDKVYPKGYVEMLEQQQSQLVSGLQEMYHRLEAANLWDQQKLHETNGHPLTHDILAALNLLETKHDGSGETEVFEDDVQKLQSRLIAEGRGFAQRRASFSSDSDNSQHGNARSASTATPVLSKPNVSQDNFNFGSNASTPLTQSPVPHSRSTKFPTQITTGRNSFQTDPQLYSPEWVQVLNEAVNTPQASQARFGIQQSDVEPVVDDMDSFLNVGQWTPNIPFDANFNSLTTFPQFASLQSINDLAPLDGMDVDFNKFVNANPPAPMEVYT